mmetsp:Transcript_7726/g.15948  ORF Transcript_7726/g.15948 Transcript_7726/m.15948 type:complete len:101 (-) Transcript_7726:380-682(-)
MRSFLTIFALLLVAVSALRRGPASPKQWYPTPYGWGFENIPDRSEEQPTQEVSKMQEKAMKEVKRVKTTPKKDPKTKHFGVSSDKEHMWMHPEEVLDGLE